MKDSAYLPEGRMTGKYENEIYKSSPKMLARAMREERILEGNVTSCRADSLDLTVDLGDTLGIIPKEEASAGRDMKDIAVLTRVGRPVAFTVTSVAEDGSVAYLSRRRAQEMCQRDYISRLVPGDIIDATVTHLDPFGAFVDIGCGFVSLLAVDCISVSRISHPSDRLRKGEAIKVVVKSVEESGRIYVTLRELLGTWEENAATLTIGTTVAGMVRSIEDYGIFVELAPNLAGLAERRGGVEVGDACAVYIKNIVPDRMKVKLSLIDSYAAPQSTSPIKYFVDTESVKHIGTWRYSPLGCPKVVETIFE